MEINILFKIAAVGVLITLLSQVLKHSGREEISFFVQLLGLILVIGWIIPYVTQLFQQVSKLFEL